MGLIAAGLHAYDYGIGDPVSNNDPLGLWVGRDSGGCDPPPDPYDLVKAGIQRLGELGAGWFGGFVGGIVGDKVSGHLEKNGIRAYADMHCEFDDASQRGCLICKKRCKYKCSPVGHIVVDRGKNGVYHLSWKVEQLDICTQSLVFCSPSWEEHACEDKDELKPEKLLPTSPAAITVTYTRRSDTDDASARAGEAIADSVAAALEGPITVNYGGRSITWGE